jgi:putative ABC transport system ATP-binding protein
MYQMKSLVACRGLTKSFGIGDQRTLALRGIDLDISESRLTMFIGPSGCGKTTLISIIAGTMRPDDGTCTVMGTEISRLGSDDMTDFRAKYIGFVFQAYNLFPTLNAVQNAALPLIVQGCDRAHAHDKAADLLSRVGLGNRLTHFPSQLSGGQQQRVAIARSLIHDPSLIVCDEPTSALDHESGHTVMTLFKELTEELGKTLIVVTHDSRILNFADVTVSLNDGEIDLISETHQ